MSRARRIASASFSAGRAAISKGKLTRALERRDELEVFQVMSAAISAFERSFDPRFRSLLSDVQAASGNAAAKSLRQQLQSRAASARNLGFRVAAPRIELAFDRTNPKAKKWVEDHATDTIEEMSKATREAIKDLVDQAFDGEFDVHELADEIALLIGDDARAETIARTETMTASNQGQQALWDQAVDEGLLTGKERQVWIVTPDDRLCPICEPLDGQEADFGETFDTELGKVDGPPAHPRCRCTIGLSL